MSTFQNNPPQLRILPLSFGIEKAIIDSLSGKDEITDHVFSTAVFNAFTLAYPKSEVKAQLQALVVKVNDRIATYQNQPDSQKGFQIKIGKSLGSHYAEWLSELNSEQVCLYLADYDVERAYKFYWESDTLMVVDAVQLKSEHDSQKILVQMEAALYGQGGKYKDDDGEAKHFDISSDEAKAALKGFGF